MAYIAYIAYIAYVAEVVLHSAMKILIFLMLNMRVNYIFIVIK